MTSASSVNKLHVKKGDTVEVIAGKDKGLRGTVLEAYPARQRVLVEGVNKMTRHVKPGQSTARGVNTGGLVVSEAPIHISNVQLVDPESGQRTRTGSRFDEDGRKVRVAKRTGKDI